MVVIGDAAHCFPPNLGLGVNTGFEDACLLMRVIDEANVGDSVSDIAKRYEKLRDDDITELMKIAKYASPYISSQFSLGSFLWMIGFFVKAKLAGKFPSLINPTLRDMTRTNMSFSDIWRRDKVSTLRIWAALVTMIIVPLAAYFWA